MRDPKLYTNSIRVPEGTSGRFSIRHLHKPANTTMTTAPTRSALFGGQRSESITFKEPTTWHNLYEGGSLWMSDLPCEQAQMRGLLAPLKGRLLVGGLGLGLAVNLACERKEITSITVVERSPEVIALVGPYLRRNGHEVTLIEADLYDFLAGWKKGDPGFDSALYDIWAGDGESDLYTKVIPLHRLSERAKIPRVTCWQEDVMRGQLRLNSSFLLIEKAGGAELRKHLKIGTQAITQEELAKETDDRSLLWLFPRAVCWDNCYPADGDEAQACANRFAQDFGARGWLSRWKVDEGLLARWYKEADRIRARHRAEAEEDEMEQAEHG